MVKKSICLLIIFVVCFTSLNVLAAPDTAEGFEIPIDVMLNGDFILCTQKPFIENGTTYIPIRSFADAIGATLTWNDADQSALLEKNGISILFYADQNNYVQNGTKVDGNGAKLHKDTLFAPVKALCSPFGWEIAWDDFYYVVYITAPGITVAETCKDFSYTFNDMLWLSKLTHIECGNQSIATRIGVANTVLNRVASPLYPNTIPEAIMDTKHGVQYPPAQKKKMKNCVPSASSMIAAKCALNGINLVGNSVAFTHVDLTAQSWAANNMQHFVTIGVVAFYAF